MAKIKQIVECVPNFSEGRDKNVIKQITDVIEEAGGVKLLDVDPGEATNRTVVTFVGEPEAVVEAAFKAVKKAGELIDMRKHHGAHPRMGATDVLPLVPVSGITLEECAELARKLAKRIADRVISINMMGTLIVITICVLAFLMNEGYLVDIAMIYTMLSFLAVVLLTKIYMGVYREKRRRREAAENQAKEDEAHE